MNPPVYWMVGAGGTGSILFQPLLRMLRTTHEQDFILAVMDGDEVEAKNLERQLFTGAAVSENKARALVDPADENCRAIAEFLTDDNIGERILEGDVVIICADNYQVRARIERRAMELDNVTVINGGNELHDGSVQVFLRRGGLNVTPPLSWEHEEILTDDGPDPAALSCIQRATMPGGEQTIVANMMSATLILNAIHRLLEDNPVTEPTIFFDLNTQRVRGVQIDGDWVSYDPRAVPA